MKEISIHRKINKILQKYRPDTKLFDFTIINDVIKYTNLQQFYNYVLSKECFLVKLYSSLLHLDNLMTKISGTGDSEINREIYRLLRHVHRLSFLVLLFDDISLFKYYISTKKFKYSSRLDSYILSSCLYAAIVCSKNIVNYIFEKYPSLPYKKNHLIEYVECSNDKKWIEEITTRFYSDDLTPNNINGTNF